MTPIEWLALCLLAWLGLSVIAALVIGHVLQKMDETDRATRGGLVRHLRDWLEEEDEDIKRSA